MIVILFRLAVFCFSDFRWYQKNAHKKTADEIPAEGNCQKNLKGASVWATWLERGSAILRNENEFRKTSGRRWSAWLNPKMSRISTSLFPFLAEKLGKRWRSGQSGYSSSTITYFKNKFIRNENEFRKTTGRRWRALLKPKYSWIVTSSFPLSAEKSRKSWRSGYCSSTITFF